MAKTSTTQTPAPRNPMMDLEMALRVQEMTAEFDERGAMDSMRQALAQAKRLVEAMERAIAEERPTMVLGQGVSVGQNVERAAQDLERAQAARKGASELRERFDAAKASLAPAAEE